MTIIQLPHQPTLTEPRGGANTSDHIDILGSTGLNELLVKVVTGHADEVKERFVSSVREYAKNMHWD
jgi:phospholipid:diacylglycerol acyltransferase